ncbi:MAG: hypothetical protein H6718_32260 [Polyangiaceae bacterium]|nr:hypothetical protein [Polyangiaceae bacterium]
MRSARFTAATLALSALALAACGESTDHPIVSDGGSAGFAGEGGSAGSGNAGSANGGSGNGGSGNGGGGNGGGGNAGTGGWPNGGSSSGGSDVGGAAAGGAAAGGAAAGGTATGGTATGGTATGGSAGNSGSGGSGGDSGSGGSGGAPPVVWKLHRFSLSTNTWQTFPLDQVWTGAGAPPPRDISATTNLDVFSTPMLLVFTTSGQYYLRRGSVWSHASIGSKFFHNSSTVEAAYSVPWNHTSNTNPAKEDVYLSSFPNAGVYSVDSNLNITQSRVQALVDEAGAAPPQGSVPPKFWTLVGDADNYVEGGLWISLYVMLDNGNLYETANDFQWNWQPATSFYFFQTNGAPNPNTLTAAYYEVAGNVVNFVGP